MGVKVQNPTTAQIEELRQRFNTKYANSPPAGEHGLRFTDSSNRCEF